MPDSSPPPAPSPATAEWIDWIPDRNYNVRPSRAEERRVIALCNRVGRPVPPEVEQWANEEDTA